MQITVARGKGVKRQNCSRGERSVGDGASLSIPGGCCNFLISRLEALPERIVRRRIPCDKTSQLCRRGLREGIGGGIDKGAPENVSALKRALNNATKKIHVLVGNDDGAHSREPLP